MLLIPRFLQVIDLVPALVVYPYLKKQEWGILLLITGSGIHSRNISERVQTMCGGTLTLESTDKVGTKIKIHIPNQKTKQNYKKEKINDEK